MLFIFLHTTSQIMIDYCLKKYKKQKPVKIIILVTSEQEDEERIKYEKLYPRYKDQISLYAGDKKGIFMGFSNRDASVLIPYGIKLFD